MKRRVKGISRMEDAGHGSMAGASEEDIDSQNSNIPIDHPHPARICQ